MNKSIKILFLFLITGILNTVFFIKYIKSTDLPGGDVGMAPFIVIIGSGMCLIISFAVYLFLNKKYTVNVIKSILLYQFIYMLILMFAFGGSNPFDKQIDQDFRNINLWMYLISFIVTGLLIMLNIVFIVITKIKANSLFDKK